MNFHFTSNGHFGLVSPSPDVISLGKTNSVKLCHTKPVPFPSEKKDRKNETLGQNLSAKDPSHTVRRFAFDGRASGDHSYFNSHRSALM